MQHEDHKGHCGVLRPGDMQWMQAAKGIVHSEMPLHDGPDDVDPVGLQLWVDLPHDKKLGEPDYQELSTDQMPYAHPSEDVEIKVISGEADGNAEEGKVTSPVKPHVSHTVAIFFLFKGLV